MTTKLAQVLPTFKGEPSRVRCFLHIVNLIAKAIIHQFDSPRGRQEAEEDEVEDEEFESDSTSADEIDDDDDDDDDDDESASTQSVRVVLNKVCFCHAFC